MVKRQVFNWEEFQFGPPDSKWIKYIWHLNRPKYNNTHDLFLNLFLIRGQWFITYTKWPILWPPLASQSVKMDNRYIIWKQ